MLCTQLIVLFLSVEKTNFDMAAQVRMILRIARSHTLIELL